MKTSMETRRTFVGGAVASAALVGPAVLMRRHVDGSIPSVATLGGSTKTAHPLAATNAEMDHWHVALGRNFRLATDDGTVRGTLTRVAAASSAGPRPAPIRQQSFQVHFTLDTAEVPGRDAIYALDRPIAGLRELFMTGGIDEAGQVMLTAVIG